MFPNLHRKHFKNLKKHAQNNWQSCIRIYTQDSGTLTCWVKVRHRTPVHSYLDNDEQLVVSCEEVSLRGVERSLVLPPLEARLGTPARDALYHCRLTHLHLHTQNISTIHAPVLNNGVIV
jgi:hypothetical protein